MTSADGIRSFSRKNSPERKLHICLRHLISKMLSESSFHQETRRLLFVLLDGRSCKYNFTIPKPFSFDIRRWYLFILQKKALQKESCTIVYVTFSAECCLTTVIHYLKNKVGVVDFANAQGLTRARGLLFYQNQFKKIVSMFMRN